MSSFVRTTHATHPLLISSKMVVVLLLIFLPAIAFANPIYQSSSNRYATPSTVGAQSMQYQPTSYQMTNMPNYQISTTYSPAQTLYTPFSSESPSSSNDNANEPSKISGRKNNYGEGWGDAGDVTTGTETYPLGDAWSLLIFATLGAGVIYLKQRKRREVQD